MEDVIAKIAEISKKAYIAEEDALRSLAPYLADFKKRESHIKDRAAKYLNVIKGRPQSFTQKMLASYPMKSQSGRALMSLAESLIRVPDKETAYELINDKIKDIGWKPQRSNSGLSFLNAAIEAALTLASKTGANMVVHKAFTSAFAKLGDEFVLAENMESAVLRAKKFKKQGYLFSYDMLGEGARTYQQAEDYFNSYMHAINSAEEGDSISMKISALHPRYELLKLEQLEKELLPLLRQLVYSAKQRGLKITIDAEEVRRLDLSLIIFSKLYAELDYENFGLAVQAYNKRSLEVLKFLANLGSVKIPVRLVKGAYWDAEIKRAQELGLKDFPLYTVKQHSDLSYLACAKFLLDNNDKFYPQFGTHNLLTIISIDEMGQGKNYEFQKLYGMGNEVYDALHGTLKAPVRIYAPVGGHEELLSYLIRRLLENGANSSFVNQLATGDAENILRSPFVKSTAANIVMPADIFPGRKNSKGFELGNLHELEKIKDGLATTKLQLGQYEDSSAEDCISAIKAAKTAQIEWNEKSVDERAEIIERAADLMEKNRFLFFKAIMQEGKKTIADAISELREAIDFCRYYSNQARQQMQPKRMAGVTGEENIYSLGGKGIFICISPWNFPLAIFTGQVVAALVTGNSVVAKPAEQTPTIAQIAVDILHRAGVPKAALALVYGSGKVVGKLLTENPGISGICFTGGTDTAKKIQSSIQSNKAIIPFIAETGGQNAMIVDSTALLEQAVDDIITSAFGSSGQRCSALRVLYVQEEIADKLIELIRASAASLEQSAELSSDMRGIIDADAEGKILAHIAKYGQKYLPAIIELQKISELEGEVFGPVLHIIRFKDIDAVINEINSTGYGLTFGVHSRIMRRAKHLAASIKSGNVYINRSMIGAVVESQPFGGVGLSGTGFKAGGPAYLLRFCDEKAVTTNLTAIGGNFDIL